MPNKNRTPKNRGRKQNFLNPTTTDDSEGIICRDRPVTLSDERLKGLLLRIYERARRDASKFSFFNCYGVLFSFAFALFIALLTANFKDFPLTTEVLIKGVCIEKIAWIVFCAFCVLGWASFLANRYYKPKNETEERDKAIEDMLKELIYANNQYELNNFGEYFTE